MDSELHPTGHESGFGQVAPAFVPSLSPRSPLEGSDTATAEAALAAKLSRKRTKTGCLTCRKRRIKCGEERPTCRNCIKSKRHCEGYSQRVVFKQPSFDYRPLPNGAHITFQTGPGPAPLLPYTEPQGSGVDPMVYGQPRAHPPESYANYYDPRTTSYLPSSQLTFPSDLQAGPSMAMGQIPPPQFRSMMTMPQNHGNGEMAYSQPDSHVQAAYIGTQTLPGPITSGAHVPVPFTLAQPMPVPTIFSGLGGLSVRSPLQTGPPASPSVGYFIQSHQSTNPLPGQPGTSLPYGNIQPSTPLGSNQTWTDTVSTRSMSHGQVSPVSATLSQSMSFASSPASAQQPQHQPRPPQTQAQQHHQHSSWPSYIARPESNGPMEHHGQSYTTFPDDSRNAPAIPSTIYGTHYTPWRQHDQNSATTFGTIGPGQIDHSSQLSTHAVPGRINEMENFTPHDGQLRRYDQLSSPIFIDRT